MTGSSSGYHRAELVDQFIHHFLDWWLLGVKDTSDWGLDMWDVQNQYVNVGETGGLLAFVFFILVISRSFGMLGDARKRVDGDKGKEWMLWCLGSAMFANVVAFFGVNYFDQSRIWWFILLAMISAIAVPMLKGHGIAVEPLGEEKLTIQRPWFKARPSQSGEKDAATERPGKLVPRLR